MKKIIKYLFLALFAGFTMVSCDFLDVVPAEKASDKDAFSSPKAAERFLYSCYGYIPQINMVQTCLDFSGDEIISPFTQESYVKFAEGVYTSGNLIISYWNDLFLGIRQCYLLKKNITSVPRIDQATIDSYVAQADFLIAYFHMLLIKCYGPVVLVKELPVLDTPKDNLLGRTSYELCAGVCDKEDASPLVSAQRELWEETGYGKGNWQEYMVISANPSTHTNLTHCFLATDVEPIDHQHLEDTEDLSVHLLTFEEVKQLLENNEIMQSLNAAPLWKYVAEHAADFEQESVEKVEHEKTETISHRINDLLYYQNSISRSLSRFLKDEEVETGIYEILKDILAFYRAGRAYIFETDEENHFYNCTYEVVAEGVKAEINKLQEIPVDFMPWWTSQILGKKPILFETLKPMPGMGQGEYEVLSRQGIKALMATPLVVNDHVYGFMGVDLVDGSASWSDEDYRWLSSLANVISICLELRRAKEKVIFEQAALARSERLFKNIFANIPAGVEIYDKEGNLVDLNERDMDILGISDKSEGQKLQQELKDFV